MKGHKVFLSESELEVLLKALEERGFEFEPDQDVIDSWEPYDEIACTLNVLALRWVIEEGYA